jgi:hypothetical protein
MSRKIGREINHKIWECPPHNFEWQPGKKKGTNDYQLKSCIVGQKAGSLISVILGWEFGQD